MSLESSGHHSPPSHVGNSNSSLPSPSSPLTFQRFPSPGSDGITSVASQSWPLCRLPGESYLKRCREDQMRLSHSTKFFFFFLSRFAVLDWFLVYSKMIQLYIYIHNLFNIIFHYGLITTTTKSLQSCPTLCDPRDGSPPGSPVPGILQARTLEWVAISFSMVYYRILNIAPSVGSCCLSVLYIGVCIC